MASAAYPRHKPFSWYHSCLYILCFPLIESQETIQNKFDVSIALILSLWPALTLAVTNNWGGPSSSDKRDWFAGAISDLFISNPATDLEDVETVLLQIMLDEFEVNVDDESAFEVAERDYEIEGAMFEGGLCGSGNLI